MSNWEEEKGLEFGRPAPPPAPDTGGEGNWTKPAEAPQPQSEPHPGFVCQDGRDPEPCAACDAAAPSPAREHGLARILEGGGAEYHFVCKCKASWTTYDSFNAHLRAEVRKEALRDFVEAFEPVIQRLRNQAGKE